MTDLSSLIERIEKSEGADEGALIEEAWEVLSLESAAFRNFATAPVSGFGNNAGRFGSLMDARAYLDAAMTLVPEGCAVDLTIWAGRNRARILPIYHDEAGDRWLHRGSDPHFCANAVTPALALCAATLRARMEVPNA